MSKITLNNVADLTQTTTAQTTINSNSSTVQTAFDNTLSRDGTSPNQMGAALDMNSNQIINLPVPSTNNSPARLIDVVSNPTIVVPGTGTSGHTVPFLDGNNTWSGTNVFSGGFGSGATTFNGDVYFKSGRPWVDVKAFGAIGNGVADDTTAIQNAINAVIALTNNSGGVVYFPPGGYLVSSTLNVVTSGVLPVRLVGASSGSVFLFTLTDITVLNINGSWCTLENMFIAGKGIQDSVTFGATQPTVLININSVDAKIEHCYIIGGLNALAIKAPDVRVNDTYCASSYGSSIVYVGGAQGVAGVRFTGCKFDQNWPVSTPAMGYVINNWQSAHAYVLGDVVLTQGYYLQCSSLGTSGSVAPTLKKYGVGITDGSVTWLLVHSSNYAGLNIDSGASETFLSKVDFTGSYSDCVQITDNSLPGHPPFMNHFNGCVFSTQINSCFNTSCAAYRLIVMDCELFGGFGTGNGSVCNFTGTALGDAKFIGNDIINGNLGGLGLNVGNNYIVGNNIFYGGGTSVPAILITSPVSHVNISHNIFKSGISTPGAVPGTSDYIIYMGNDASQTSSPTFTNTSSGTHITVVNNY